MSHHYRPPATLQTVRRGTYLGSSVAVEMPFLRAKMQCQSASFLTNLNAAYIVIMILPHVSGERQRGRGGGRRRGIGFGSSRHIGDYILVSFVPEGDPITGLFALKHEVEQGICEA